jgi:hypothetical protein
MAQEINGSLHKSTCVNFRNCIYVAGYEEAGSGLTLKIQKYTVGLEKVTEKSEALGKYKPEGLYTPSIDTTHGYLNITVQETNNEKTASLIRYTENLELVADVEKAEITRINSFAAFDAEKLYYKDCLYVAREAKDSVGRFYFYRYDLKDPDGLFNYNFKWQFNFDQHTYHRIHPAFANDEYVYLYVICLDGPKKGQWLLILDAKNGNLLKTIKLNKGDNEFCFVSLISVQGNANDIFLAGTKYPAAAVDLKTGKITSNYVGTKLLNLFFCQIDSSGEIKSRQEGFVATPNELLKEKELKEFLFRCNSFRQTENGFNLEYECLYRAKDRIFRTFGFLSDRLVITPDNTIKQDNFTFFSVYRNEKKYTSCKEVANQYDNDKPTDADRLFYKDAFVKNFSPVNSDLQKKEAGFVSAYNNKKAGTLELYKYVMKNYNWETSSIKNVTDYSRCMIFRPVQNKVVIFYTTKGEKNFVLLNIEL